MIYLIFFDLTCYIIQIKSNKMNQTGRRINISEFTLSIDFVTLTVQFPCKMYLKHKNERVSGEVQANSRSQFVFNQKMVIRNNMGKDQFQFTVHLTTQKERSIIAGSLKLCTDDIIKSQGKTTIFGLYKCLDQQARCQIKVIEVKRTNIRKRLNRLNTISFYQSQQLSQQKSSIESSSNEAFRNLIIQQKINLQKLHQPSKGFVKKKESFHEIDKLQNNFILVIAKYKLRVESFEKSNQQKQNEIKRLNDQLDRFKTNMSNIQFLTQEIDNKNRLLQTYQERFQQLKKENDSLKNKEIELQRNLLCISDRNKFEAENLKYQYQTERASFVNNLNQANQKIAALQFEAQNNSRKLQKMKKLHDQIQRKNSQAKQYYQTTIKTEQQRFDRQLGFLQHQLKDSQSELQEKKQSVKRLQKQFQQLSSRLKHQQTVLSLANEEINFLKSDLPDNDKCKIKLAEANLHRGIMEINFIQTEGKYKRLQSKQQSYQQQQKILEGTIFELKRENQRQKLKNMQLTRIMERMQHKLQYKQHINQRSSSISKQCQSDINYKQIKQYDWREIAEDKNEQITQLRGLVDQFKNQLCAEQIRRTRDLDYKDKEIRKLNDKISLQSEIQQDKGGLKYTPSKAQHFKEIYPQDYSPKTGKLLNASLQKDQLRSNSQLQIKSLSINNEEEHTAKKIDKNLNNGQLLDQQQIVIGNFQQQIKTDKVNGSKQNTINCALSESSINDELKRDCQLQNQRLKECLKQKEKKIVKLTQNQRDYQKLMESYQNNSTQMNQLIADLSPAIVKISQGACKEEDSVINLKINDIKQQMKLNQIERQFIKKSKSLEGSLMNQNNEITMEEYKSFNSSSFLNQFNQFDYQTEQKSQRHFSIAHKIYEKQEQFGDYINSIFQKQPAEFYKNRKRCLSAQQQSKNVEQRQEDRKEIKYFHFDEIFDNCPTIKQIINNSNREIEDEVKSSDEIIVWVSSLKVQKIMYYLNNFIRELQSKCISIHGEDQKNLCSHKDLVQTHQEEFTIGSFNVLDYEIGHDRSPIRNNNLSFLQAENNKLKFQLEQIMQDYYYRIDAMAKLEGDLAFLESNINKMNIEQQRNRAQITKQKAQLQVYEDELVAKESEIQKAQARIEGILFYYGNELESKNNSMQLERKNHLKIQNKHQEQILVLKNTANLIQSQKKQLQQFYNLYKDKIDMIGSSQFHIRDGSSDRERNTTFMRQKAQEQKKQSLIDQIAIKNNQIIQFQDRQDKTYLQIDKIKIEHRQEIQQLKRKYNSDLLGKLQKIINLENIIQQIRRYNERKKSTLYFNAKQSLKQKTGRFIKNRQLHSKQKEFASNYIRKAQSTTKQIHKLGTKDLKLLQMIENEYKYKQLKQDNKQLKMSESKTDFIGNGFIEKPQIGKDKSFSPATQDYIITQLTQRQMQADILFGKEEGKNIIRQYG